MKKVDKIIGITAAIVFIFSLMYYSIQNIFDCQENKDVTNDEFNAYLKRLSESAIVQFCNKVVAGESDFITGHCPSASSHAGNRALDERQHSHRQEQADGCDRPSTACICSQSEQAATGRKKERDVCDHHPAYLAEVDLEYVVEQ